MASSRRTLLDLSVVLLVLFVSAIAISGLDAWEARVMARGEVSLLTWGQHESPVRSLEHDYMVIRNSMRRWFFIYFPLISLLGGAVVGAACSDGRRPWMLAVAATGLVPITAVGWLFTTPLSAAAAVLAYAVLAAATALAARRVVGKLRHQAA